MRPDGSKWCAKGPFGRLRRAFGSLGKCLGPLVEHFGGLGETFGLLADTWGSILGALGTKLRTLVGHLGSFGGPLRSFGGPLGRFGGLWVSFGRPRWTIWAYFRIFGGHISSLRGSFSSLSSKIEMFTRTLFFFMFFNEFEGLGARF